MGGFASPFYLPLFFSGNKHTIRKAVQNKLVNGWGMLRGVACTKTQEPHEHKPPPSRIRISMRAPGEGGPLAPPRVLAVAVRPSLWIVRPDRVQYRSCSAVPGTREDLGATEATSLSPRMTSRPTGMSASRRSMRWSCGRSSFAASTRTVSRSRRRSSK